ncbi:hypothetical protein F3Y22_tig00014370pilonHSYRG00027 [Hibiscus syriacus]|uniref:NAC domain-containing protein n=1 Tax=Hibiscus syriacus TaxID=106335 RepID=A0A6A3BZE5_HIBSY|nr:hypothetical protein F3Y22_tig00014370pilonHSYRG00027 [Hibiscus syriacus]
MGYLKSHRVPISSDGRGALAVLSPEESSFEKIDLDVIRDVDLNKLEPWDIQGARLEHAQNDWYFFSHKDKSTHRDSHEPCTAAGFWKATGRDKGEGNQEEDGWFVVSSRRKIHKTQENPISSSWVKNRNHMFISSTSNEGALDHILEYMGRTCKDDGEANNGTATRFLQQPMEIAIDNNGAYYPDSFTKLPSLDSPSSISSQNLHQNDSALTNWAAVDWIVASHLNGGQTETSRELACFNDQIVATYCNTSTTDNQDLQLPTVGLSSTSSISTNNRPYNGTQHHFNSEIDIWSFTGASSLSLSSPTHCAATW